MSITHEIASQTPGVLATGEGPARRIGTRRGYSVMRDAVTMESWLLYLALACMLIGCALVLWGLWRLCVLVADALRHSAERRRRLRTHSDARP